MSTAVHYSYNIVLRWRQTIIAERCAKYVHRVAILESIVQTHVTSVLLTVKQILSAPSASGSLAHTSIITGPADTDRR